MASKSNKKMGKEQEQELIKMGRLLRDFAEFGIDSKRLLWVSFLRGLAQGFGAIVGGTILIALMVWVLGLFNEVPFLGDAADAITDTISGR
jgi:hypothetical protein